MTSDEQLRSAFESVAERLRDEAVRLAQPVLDDLSKSLRADREQAERDARQAAEREAASRLVAAIGVAESVARERGLEEGRRGGILEGRREAQLETARAVEAATVTAYENGLAEGRREGRLEGIAAGREEAQRDAAIALEAAVAGARAEGRSEAESVAARAAAAALSAARGRVLEAVRAIGNGRSLTETLEILLASAGREAPRAAMLLVTATGFTVWRGVGFDPPLVPTSAADRALQVGGLVSEAARTSAAASGRGDDGPAFAGLAPQSTCLAVPISVRGQTVAVLYADRGSQAQAISGVVAQEPVIGNAGWADDLELLSRHASSCLEALLALKAMGTINGGGRAPLELRA